MFGDANIPAHLRSFMSRPCNITTDDKLWAVGGMMTDGNGGGVLAWCYDEHDAEYVADQFRQCDQFMAVEASKYIN